MIEITEETYVELIQDQHLYQCLRDAGVDCWNGWDDAIELYNNTIEDVLNELNP